MFRSLTLIAAIIALPASAAELPKSGSFSTVMGVKIVGETTAVGGRILGHGTGWNVIVGDNPLHIRIAACVYVSEQDGDTASFNGRCAWSDADGDRIFSQWSGTCTMSTGLCEGPQSFTGGSGKFRGIEGSNPYKGQIVGDQGQLTATNQWTYRLP